MKRVNLIMSHVPHSDKPDSEQNPTSTSASTPGRTAVFDRRGEDELEQALPTSSTTDAAEIDLDDPLLYQNRELTWLLFNSRVLSMAADPNTPLLERVKFLSVRIKFENCTANRTVSCAKSWYCWQNRAYASSSTSRCLKSRKRRCARTSSRTFFHC